MPYTHATFGQAKAQLAARLYDTSANVFWSDAEKGQYIIESLRVWNSLTSFWRSEFLLALQQNTVWYDITDVNFTPNTNRPATVTDNDVLQLIQYHLLEPLTANYPLAWAGSAQFTADDLLSAIQRKRDEVLSLTGCVISRQLVPAVPGRTFLSDSTIDIRRVAWLPVNNPTGYTATPLWPSDQWATQSYERDYTTRSPGNPATYRQSSEPPLSFDVDIPPAVPGNYEVLSVNAGAGLSTTAASLLGVPDDFCWTIKWGALADLLGRESNAKDSSRAKYCQMRYQQGIVMLLNSPAVLYGLLNNLPIDIDSAQSMDNYMPTWQAKAAGQPDVMMMAGLNLVGFSVTPDAGPYSVSLHTVRNAPLPVLDADYLQLGRDDYDAILDHAQHIAAFKMGGTEFLSTMPLLQAFHQRAAVYTSKLLELGEFSKAMYDLSGLQAEANPVYSTTDLGV